LIIVMGRLISLAHLTLLFETPPPEAATVAAEAGYGALGRRLNPSRINLKRPQEAPFPMLGDTPMRRETLRRLADTGLQVLDIEMLTLRAETRIEEFLPVLETGARLGARRVMTCGHDDDEQRVTTRFAEVCEAAAGFGLGVDLEFMAWLGVSTIAQAERVVRNAGQPNGGILIDALHLQRTGGTAADVAAADPAHIHHIQLCDGALSPPATASDIADESRFDRRFPGDGELDLTSLLRALPAGVPISVEAPVREALTPISRARRALAGTCAVLATAGLE
jgi:sugar phosphate isomerase/epimerase